MTDHSRRPTLLLVGGVGPAPTGEDIARVIFAEAAVRDLRVELLVGEKDLAAVRTVSEQADDIHLVDPENIDLAVNWARKTTSSYDIIFTTREFMLPAAAAIAEYFKLPFNSIVVTDLIRHKNDCRAALADAGFRQPLSLVCSSPQDVDSAIGTNGGPWVVKPRVGAGSIGVRLAESVAEVRNAVAALSAEPEGCLVEQFIDGPEYSVEGLFVGEKPVVLAVTGKEKFSAPHFAERQHVIPAPIERSLRQEMEDTVAAAVSALGMRQGLFHVELWNSSRGIILGEVHARLGGDYIHRLLTAAIPGLEMFGDVFDDALGRPVRSARWIAAAGATRYLDPPAGVLRSVSGWAEAVADNSVIGCELLVSPGDTIPGIHDSSDRVACIAVKGSTVDEALNTLGRLERGISFEVSP